VLVLALVLVLLLLGDIVREWADAEQDLRVVDQGRR